MMVMKVKKAGDTKKCVFSKIIKILLNSTQVDSKIKCIVKK